MSEPLGYAPAWCAEFPNDNPTLHDGVSWVCLSVGGPLRPVARARPRLRPVRDALPRVTEVVDRAPEAFPAAEALLATDTAEAADAPPPVEAPGLVEARCEDEPLELEGIGAPGVDVPAPLELDALETATAGLAAAVTTSEEPLELDAIARPAWDDVFDFDTDGSDSIVAPAVEQAVAEPAAAAATETAAPSPASAFTAYVAALVDVALAAGHTRAAALLPRLVDGTPFGGVDLPEDVERQLVAADVLARSGDTVAASDSFAAVATAWRRVLSGETNDLADCGDSTLDGWSADLLRAFGIGQGGAADVRRELRRRGVAAFGMLLAA